MKRHILKKNETLEMLSARYGLPICMIARANGGFKEGIRCGMDILIPSADLCSLIGGEYTVTEEDTLLSISQKTGTVMREILHLNGISPAELRAGMHIFLPKSARIYTVGCAETLHDVIRNSGADEAELCKLNDLAGGVYRGMQIKLPWD